MTEQEDGVAGHHESIEELLAGYVLRSLSGEDATGADRLLFDHVPHCLACRDSLAVFQAVAADLSLVAAPIAPPETLLPRLHRELGAPGRLRRPIAIFAIAASVAAVVGLAGLTITEGARARNSESRMNDIAQAFDFARQPAATMAQVDSSTPNAEPITAITEPGARECYLVGRDIPVPPDGAVYRVWLVSGTSAAFATDFRPALGLTVVHIKCDPSRLDGIVISVEPAGSIPDTPGAAAWKTAS